MTALPQPLLRIPAKNDLVTIEKRIVAGRQELVETIMATVSLDEASFDNVYAPLLRYDDDTLSEANMSMTLNSPPLTPMSKPRSRRGRSNVTMAAGERTDGLDPESKRRLEKRVDYLKRLGHGSLDKDTRKAYLDTRKEINDLCREMNRNIRLYNGGSLLFTDKELDGLENEDVEKCEKDNSGRRLVPLNRVEFTKIIAFATNYKTRKLFHGAWTSRLSENVPIFRKIVLLRDENAHRLGFQSDANLCLAGRMAKSTAWVEELLADLTNLLREPARDIFRKLEVIKAKLLQEGSEAVNIKADTVVENWELEYLKKLEAKEHNVDQQAISAYLPFKETTAAILRNVTRYLQLRLELLAKEDLVGCVWSDDVDVWAIWDEGEDKGQFLGYFYCDLLDRPNKYKHNQTAELQGSFLRADGSRPYPAAILMCSFSPDVVDGCKVLKHANLITIYHGKWSDSHGYRVCLEFGEAIGTCMENYAWLLEELKSISCHYIYTGDEYMQKWMERHPGQALPPLELPTELVREMIHRRPKHRITYYLKQLADASFDMAVHNPKTHQDLEALDETKLYQDLEAQSTFTPVDRLSYPQAAFSHLVSGYNSGYYAYICSNVFGEEIFQSNFAADPTSTAAWNRFRHELLEYGGSRDQTEVLEAFLGRPPTFASLLKSLGIQ